jgi:hypothetical protein
MALTKARALLAATLASIAAEPTAATCISEQQNVIAITKLITKPKSLLLFTHKSPFSFLFIPCPRWDTDSFRGQDVLSPPSIT